MWRVEKMLETNLDDNLLGCQYSCRAIFQKELKIEDLETVIGELKRQIDKKDKKIKNFESIKEEMEKYKDQNILRNLIIESDKLLDDNMPVFNYLRKRTSSIEEIKAIFLYTKENLYDLWFIIEKNDFNLKHTISEIFCDIVEIFDSIIFDLMVLTSNDVDIEKLKEESYKTIYIKG